MSVIESFYMLFKADTSPAKRAIQKLKKGIDSLTKSLKENEKVANKFEKALRNIGKDVTKWTAEFLAAEEAVRQFRRAIEYGEQLDETSRILGVNVSQLEAWTFAIKKAGGTAAGFERSLHGVAENIGTSSAVVLQLLPQFADAFQKMGRVQALRYGKSIGFDEPTILLLRRGRAEIEKLIQRQKELGVLTDSDRKQFQDFNSATGDLSHAFRFLWLRLALTVLPILTELSNVLTRVFVFLNQNSELVIVALIGVAGAAAFMASSVLLAAAPFVLMAGAIGVAATAIAVLYEDIKRFVNGQPSLLGDFVGNWKSASRQIARVLGWLIPQFKPLSDAIELILIGIKKVREYFGGGSNNKITVDMVNAKNLLSNAASTPLASQTTTSITGGASDNRSVSVGAVTIQTQSTDAEGIAAEFRKSLLDQLSHSNNQFDNGVLI